MIRHLAVWLVILSAHAAPAATPEVQGATLTLDHALQLARAHLPALRQARAQAEQARGLYDEVRAAWYPTLSAAASYKRTTANLVATPGANLSREALPAPSLTT